MIKIRFLFFGFFFFFLIRIAAQEQTPSSSQKLTTSIFTYDLGFNEQHAAFKINYELKPSLEIELRSFYDTYLLTNRFNNSLLLKKYFYDNFYLLSGIDMELNISKIPTPKLNLPRLGFKAGVGYEVKDSWLIEATYNGQLNNSKSGVFGEQGIAMPKVYSLSSKVRF